MLGGGVIGACVVGAGITGAGVVGAGVIGADVGLEIPPLLLTGTVGCVVGGSVLTVGFGVDIVGGFVGEYVSTSSRQIASK